MTTPTDQGAQIRDLERRVQRIHIASLELADAALELSAIGLNSTDAVTREHSNRAFDAVSKAIQQLGEKDE